MSTNYYWYEKPDCECCGRPFKRLHIGKSAAGWCFYLHVMPERGINSLDDWRKLWLMPASIIRDEYGDAVSVVDIEDIITNRAWRGKEPRRHEIDGYCISHGPGTWDHIVGEFS